MVTLPFRSIQRVYFDDLDALNILHNMRFLLFVERARGELFNALGFHWQDPLDKNPDKFHVVAEHRIQYLAPVRGEGEIAITLDPPKLGRTSLSLPARVTTVDGETLFATATTRLVRLDPTSFRPAPWSAPFRSVLEGLTMKTQ